MRKPRARTRWAAVRTLALAALACAAMAAWSAQSPDPKRKAVDWEGKNNGKKEETQRLETPRDLPLAVVGETRQLAFHVTPLSAKGLLSQQVRDALKELGRQASGQTVLRIRAFVAGSGDPRRVRDLVSQNFGDRHQPLPALSLVKAGALPLTGAQVVLEAEATARKDVNPHGLAWISGQVATSADPLGPVAPLTARSLAALLQSVRAAGAEPRDVLRVTCFFSSFEDLAASRALVEAEYPKAALDYIQTKRAPDVALGACEAVARLPRDPGSRLRLIDADAGSRDPGESQIALVAAPRVALTGSQVSFGYEEKDSQLAFTRLRAALEQAGASMRDVACARYYPLADALAGQVRRIRAEFFDPEHGPAGTILLFEGLPSLDAGFAVDAVAARD
jgi:enamine deaminase RidA (YjgF/YER057c/UK114 family)